MSDVKSSRNLGAPTSERGARELALDRLRENPGIIAPHMILRVDGVYAGDLAALVGQRETSGARPRSEHYAEAGYPQE